MANTHPKYIHVQTSKANPILQVQNVGSSIDSVQFEAQDKLGIF